MTRIIRSFLGLASLPLALFSLSCQPKATEKSSEFRSPPLEQTASETQRMADQIKARSLTVDPLLLTVIATGTRNLAWQKHINQHRPQNSQISFSDANSNEGGFPVDSPKIYNPEIIRQNFDELIPKLPKEMHSVLIQNQTFSDDLPVEMETYRKWGREVDRAYQVAIRWVALQPYLDYLIRAKATDVRGYLDLVKTNDIPTLLKNYLQLSTSDQSRLKSDLIGICGNSNTASDSLVQCNLEFTAAANSAQLVAFHQKYWSPAKEHYEAYFKLQVARTDVKWSGQNTDQMIVPFLNPKNNDFYHFLKDNIEAEWKAPHFQLVLDFQDSSPAEIPHLEFLAGALPHVNAIGGNTITMDANTSLNEYEVNWIIRHEYGHVIGFPDCYLEFYDTDKKAMISYQLDVKNIMCSRAGHVGDLHIHELTKAYKE